MNRSILSLSLLVLSALHLGGTEAESGEISLTPTVHGVIRSRYEMETSDGAARFQVRNARVSLTGKIAPIISYFIQVDACDRGKMKFLDAWGRFNCSKDIFIQAGQFREPFGVDNFRAPGSYYFANRSFLGKLTCNVRGVGMKVAYSPSTVPLTLEAGVFNSSSIADHEVWSKKPAFASKAVYKIGNVALTTGFQSIRPSFVRMNLVDGAVTWSCNDWIIEGEYMYLHYTNDAATPNHSYNFFVNRSFPVKLGVFNRSSVQARFDGLTDLCNGTAVGDDGRLAVTSSACNRVTVGGTLSYMYKSVRADVQLNYEKYMYSHDVIAPRGAGDKVVAELIIKF